MKTANKEKKSMIEVVAKLDRGTVYLAGESIEATVKFTNQGSFSFFITWKFFYQVENWEFYD